MSTGRFLMLVVLAAAAGYGLGWFAMPPERRELPVVGTHAAPAPPGPGSAVNNQRR
jgi:hypothetical protein